MSDRKKTGLAFWATVLLIVAFVGYPLSFGPVCWAIKRDPWRFDRNAPMIYMPIGWLCSKSVPMRRVFNWYATVLGPGDALIVPADTSRSLVIGMSRR